MGTPGPRARGARARSAARAGQGVAPLYVRFSASPEADRAVVSRDHESGCLIPGLSTNPMTPEPWWARPSEQWVSPQFNQYAHLMVGGQVSLAADR